MITFLSHQCINLHFSVFFWVSGWDPSIFSFVHLIICEFLFYFFSSPTHMQVCLTMPSTFWLFLWLSINGQVSLNRNAALQVRLSQFSPNCLFKFCCLVGLSYVLPPFRKVGLLKKGWNPSRFRSSGVKVCLEVIVVVWNSFLCLFAYCFSLKRLYFHQMLWCFLFSQQ